MAGERAYFDGHQLCEVCGQGAVYVTLKGGKKSLCRRCGADYLQRGYALMEMIRMDGMEEEAMDEVQEALERLKRYEANFYRGEKAARAAMDEKEPETVEEALERMLEREAHEYEKEV